MWPKISEAPPWEVKALVKTVLDLVFPEYLHVRGDYQKARSSLEWESNDILEAKERLARIVLAVLEDPAFEEEYVEKLLECRVEDQWHLYIFRDCHWEFGPVPEISQSGLQVRGDTRMIPFWWPEGCIFDVPLVEWPLKGESSRDAILRFLSHPSLETCRRLSPAEGRRCRKR